ncbi:YrhB domain-containing protein [Catenuloplanes indicus]|nr:YrhB domain-containing protein [Catenuloplanes indicus]
MERAVALVEAQLAVERRAQPRLPELGVSAVRRHALGWLVSWQSAEYIRTGDPGRMLVGHGPYLVDQEDGSIHHIPVTTFVAEAWEELYREQVKGMAPPDALLDAVRDLITRESGTAALRHLRRNAPRLSLREAKAYVDAVRAGDEPDAELRDRTREDRWRDVLPITTLTGPNSPR